MRKTLFLPALTIITAVLVLGLGVVFLASGPKRPPAANRNQGEARTVALTGTVMPAGPSVYMEGTHQLLDEEGELLALLKSDKIDLEYFEGARVEIEGEAVKTVEGRQRLVEVVKVRFK